MDKRTVLLLLLLALCASVTTEAHEIGTTRVAVSLAPDRTYRVEVVTDATALLAKLLAAAGAEPAAPLGAEELQKRLLGLDEVFRRKQTLAFDGMSVRPVIVYSVASPSTSATDVLSLPVATIVLTGELPHGATNLTWTYGWTFASYALGVRQATASESTVVWLEGGQTSQPFSITVPAPPMGGFEIAVRYLGLGFTHILPKGLDHMLFVLGIFLLSRHLRQVLWQVSAFTVAHSITLGLSIYGVISMPAAVVEPLIAVSIAYVAIENLFVAEVRGRRIALVFLFGLLHGMGFAGALKEVGLPRSEFVTALVTFNLGVEGGQLAVIGMAFLLVGWYCRRQAWYHNRIVMPASGIIACIAVYWTLQRLPF